MLQDINLICIIIIVIIIILVIITINIIYQNAISEDMIDIKPIINPTWNRTYCTYTIDGILSNVLSEYNIKKSNDPTLIIPCTYDTINKEIENISIPARNQRIFIIHNADNISGKDYLWKLLVEYFGINKAKTLMPNTYITHSKNDMNRFKNEYMEGKIYILKKNIQRQEGLKISNSYDDIINSNKSYVVIQELLQDPYTINGRKINMRLYILVICNENNIDIYVYNNGFMYYTREYFKPNDTSFGPNITTGYIERSVYKTNPLTHEDFKIYLDNTNRKLTIPEEKIRSKNILISEVLFNRIYKLLYETFISTISHICIDNKLKSAITFQLFGADIAVNDQLIPMIMEINKGPDMGAKDENDRIVKKKCTKDMLRLLGLIDEQGPNGFIKILDKENNKINKFVLSSVDK